MPAANLDILNQLVDEVDQEIVNQNNKPNVNLDDFFQQTVNTNDNSSPYEYEYTDPENIGYTVIDKTQIRENSKLETGSARFDALFIVLVLAVLFCILSYVVFTWYKTKNERKKAECQAGERV